MFVFHAGEYVFVATVATYAVSPLLFQPREWPIKALVQVIGVVVTRGTLRGRAASKCGQKGGKKASSPSSSSVDSSGRTWCSVCPRSSGTSRGDTRGCSAPGGWSFCP